MIRSRLKSLIENRLIQRLLDGSSNHPGPIDLGNGVYIYGAGELGMLAVEYCEACGILILGILDQNKTGVIKGRYSEYRICHPDEIPAEVRFQLPLAVAVATVAFAPISKMLKSCGWKKVLPFYALTVEKRTGHPLSNGWAVGSISEEELEKVRWVCGNWDDDYSLLHYEAFLAWHVDGTELPLAEEGIDPNQRYAIAPLLAVLSNRHQQMVDVGSHKGESIKRLLDANILFSEYVLVEPDLESSRRLKCNIQNYLPADKRVTFLNYILGASNALMPFKEGLGYCSQLWSESTLVRPVVTLDSLECRPDFLKIHTEGSEMDVLLGGIDTISKNRPVLAFSIYHNRDGLCKVPFESMQLFEGYKWYFRLHSYQGTGAFIYGVPK